MIPLLTRAISEHFRDEVLGNKVLCKSTLFYFPVENCMCVWVPDSKFFLTKGKLSEKIIGIYPRVTLQPCSSI